MNYCYKLLVLKIKEQLSFKNDSILWLIVRVLNSIMGILVLVFIFNKTLEIKGFNREECLLIYSLYTMSVDVFYCFFAWTLWYSNTYILQGKLSLVLKLPVNPFLYITFDNFALSEVFGIITGLLIFIYSAYTLNLGIVTILSLFLFLSAGTLGIIGIFLIVSSFSIKYPKIEEAFSPLMDMLDFAQYPISIYSAFIRFILTYVFPVSMIAFYPAAFSLNKYSFSIKFILLPIYSIIIFIIGYLLFIKSIKKYEGTGF